MAFKKKTWVDRKAEYINRRLITHEDGSTELVEVARDEGTILQEGDAFNAETMNNLEERIDETLGGLAFVKLTQSQYDALSQKDPNTIYFTT